MHPIRYYGWTHAADSTSTATRWISFCFLPLIPLGRYKIRVLSNPTSSPNIEFGGIPFVYVWWRMMTTDDFKILEPLPFSWGSVLRTYFNAYVVMPLGVVLPGILVWYLSDEDADGLHLVLQLAMWGVYGFLVVPGWLSFLIRKVRGGDAFKSGVRHFIPPRKDA